MYEVDKLLIAYGLCKVQQDLGYHFLRFCVSSLVLLFLLSLCFVTVISIFVIVDNIIIIIVIIILICIIIIFVFSISTITFIIIFIPFSTIIIVIITNIIIIMISIIIWIVSIRITIIIIIILAYQIFWLHDNWSALIELTELVPRHYPKQQYIIVRVYGWPFPLQHVPIIVSTSFLFVFACVLTSLKFKPIILTIQTYLDKENLCDTYRICPMKYVFCFVIRVLLLVWLLFHAKSIKPC